MIETRKSVLHWVALVAGALSVAFAWFSWWMNSQEMRAGSPAAPWNVQWSVDMLAWALVLLVGLVLAWRWPLAGVAAFIGYYVVGMVTAGTHLNEWLLVAGLLLLVPGALFLAAWVVERRDVRRRHTGAGVWLSG